MDDAAFGRRRDPLPVAGELNPRRQAYMDGIDVLWA